MVFHVVVFLFLFFLFMFFFFFFGGGGLFVCLVPGVGGGFAFMKKTGV